MFSKLDELSWAGSMARANEDICGHIGEWGWVIDGFTPSPLPPAMSMRSDAAWFVAFADKRFRELAPQVASGAEMVRRVAEEARQAFLTAAPDRTDPAFWPGAAVTLAKCSHDKLHIWRLGDTAAYLKKPRCVTMTVGELEEMRRIETENARRLLEKTGAKPGDILKTKIFRDWLEEHRRIQTKPDAVQVFGLQAEAGDAMEHVVFDAEVGTVVLLASDGFSALIELYRDLTPDAFVDKAVQGGLEPLAKRLREIETEIDPGGIQFPRFKESDDATAILLRCE